MFKIRDVTLIVCVTSSDFEHFVNYIPRNIQINTLSLDRCYKDIFYESLESFGRTF